MPTSRSAALPPLKQVGPRQDEESGIGVHIAGFSAALGRIVGPLNLGTVLHESHIFPRGVDTQVPGTLKRARGHCEERCLGR